MDKSNATIDNFLKLKKKLEEIEKSKQTHKFWDTQPVPKLTENVTEYGSFVSNETMKQRRTVEYMLPSGLEWYTVNMKSNKDVADIAEFISMYYLEDDDGYFRFTYSTEFLKWALCPPNHENTDLSLALRVSKNKKIVGFISGIIVSINVGNKIQKMADIDFLCIHPVLRKKNLASILIKEITRKIVNGHHTNQAIYTTARYLPKPITTVKFYHRYVNLPKLVDVGFVAIENSNLTKAVNYYQISAELTLDNFRKMELKDAEQAHSLLSNYMSKYTCYAVFSLNEFKHWFIDNAFVSSYVTVDPDNNITDMISYFKLRHKALKNQSLDHIEVAYVYYYTSIHNTLFKLGQNMLTMAKREGMDVVNITDIMNNSDIIDNLKFVNGSGQLHYYLFNWKCPELLPKQLGKCVF